MADMVKVTMEDGREVEFPEKRGNVICTTLGTDDNGQLSMRFDFRSGKTATVSVPDSVMVEAAAFGIEKRIVAAARGTSQAAGDENAIVLAQKISEGDFNYRASRAAGGLTANNMLVKAVARWKGIEIEEALAALKPLEDDKEKLKMLHLAPELAPIIEEIKAENKRGSKKAEEKQQMASDLLAELEA